MSDFLPQRSALILQFGEHLARARYSSTASERYLAVAGHFLKYIEGRHVPIDAVQPAHVTMYLARELRQFSRRHGRAPASVDHWRGSHTAGVHRFLRCVVGQWPPSATADSPNSANNQAIGAEYAQWLRERRGLAAETISERAVEAGRFLSWFGERNEAGTLSAVTIADVDAYLQSRAPSLRRVSRKGVAQRMRCFLRFAHATGRTERDFALCVMAPTLYAFESIPSALSPDQVKAVLQASRNDPSPKGLRDYAILLLLATYGMRAGEITRLQLSDIDWRADRIFVRHTKTGSQSILPLMPAVGEALLAYLQRGRPKTDVREIFIRMRAPYRGFVSGSSLYASTRRRLDAAGVQPDGKRGPHAFRHARAVSLLREGTPMKIIGDVLGHRSASSTSVYLKLATEDLRNVALEIPGLAEEAQS
ncbi:site-specific integrase [Roseateles sp. GG27B]